jgi:hypothetical protein
MGETDEKFKQFLDLLRKRTIEPIEHNWGITESCTAMLLLIFSTIDALSKITCSDDDFNKHTKGVAKRRFDSFIEDLMDPKYKTLKEPLYYLRCDIVHTGMGKKVMLSNSCDEQKHLQMVKEHLWIDTNIFLDDLKEAILKLRQDIQDRGKYYQNAAKRLRKLTFVDLDEVGPSLAPCEGPFNK